MQIVSAVEKGELAKGEFAKRYFPACNLQLPKWQISRCQLPKRQISRKFLYMNSSHLALQAFDTEFTRSEVTRKTFYKFIDQRFGDGKGSFLTTMNSLTYESRSMSPGLAKKIFGELLPGTVVFAARNALTLSVAGQSSRFIKKSIYGSFSPEKFVITRSLLRACSDGKTCVPGEFTMVITTRTHTMCLSSLHTAEA